MNQRSILNAGNTRRFRVISYTLVFLMMSCVVLSISILINALLPGWHSEIFAGMLLFIVLDRLYTYRQLKSITPWTSEWAISFGVHWIVILFVGRLLLSYANGLESLRADFLLLVRGDIFTFFTPEFVILLMLAYATWDFTTQFLDLLDEMGLDIEMALSENPPYIQSNFVPAHQRLVSLFFGIGIALVILTALTRLDLQTIVTSSNGMPPFHLISFSGAEAGALLYFVFGLALLSLSRLMSLQTHWNRLRIPVSSTNLPRQWAIYSLVFLLLLAIFVGLLPAGDSFGFFSVIVTLLDFIFRILLFIAQVVIYLVLFIFSIPFLLLGRAIPIFTRPIRPVLPTLPPPPATPPTPNAAWELIKSILLWGSLLAIIIFSLVHFVRQHESILAALRKSRVVNWLVLTWQWLYKNVDRTRTNVSQAILDGWQNFVGRRNRKRIIPGLNLLHLRSLDPRRQVYFFYLAMIRRSGEQGLGRKPSQTPSEYALTLEKSLPAADEDIKSITDSFIEARYTRRDVDSTKANIVKATWDRIRRALQNKASAKN